MDHRKKQPQRRKTRRRKKPKQPLWLSLSQVGAVPMTILGAVLILSGFAVNLPQDKPVLDDNTRLHQTGEQVIGHVATVEKEHHRAKHGDYDVYTPLITLPVYGVNTTVALDAYAVIDDPALYRHGKQLPMLVAPHVRSERDIALADKAPRDRLVSAVRNDLIGGIIGAFLLLAGVTCILLNTRAARRKRTKRL